MAYANVQYTGTNITGPYSVPFAYISKSHVKVRVNGVLKTQDVDYTWPTGATIQFVSAVANGLNIDIRRESSRDTRIVDHQDASILKESTLDQDATQQFDLAQEAFDASTAGIQPDIADNKLNAQSRVIKNIADPTSAQDAVTKAYGDANYGGSASSSAASSATAAATSASNAATSATAAAGSATAAAGSATAAAGSATAAASSASAAATSEANAAANNKSGSRVLGFSARNNAVTPATQFDMSAQEVVLRTATGTSVVRIATGTLTNNVATAGPVANGRDQAGAFSTNSFIYFYFIWNGTTLATLASAAAPSVGPTLPTGYTHWAFATTVRFSAGSALYDVYAYGSWVHYKTAAIVLAATNTANAVETFLDVSSVVPAHAHKFGFTSYGAVSSNGGAVSTQAYTRALTNQNLVQPFVCCNGGNTTGWGLSGIAPNLTQGLYYFFLNTTNISATQFNIDILGYQVPNGGE
jgi:hypothetical protein